MSSLLTLTAILASGCLFQASALSQGLENNVILHYGFENVTNQTVIDESGNGNTAVMFNNVSLSHTHEGICGRGLNFSGGYLNITMSKKWRNTSTLTSPFDITIAVWIWIAEYSRNKAQSIFTSYYQSQRFQFLGIRNGGIRWHMTDKTINKKNKKNKIRIFKVSKKLSFQAKQNWQHLAVTFSNATGRGVFYVNGTAIASSTRNSIITDGFIQGLPENLCWHPIIGASDIGEKQFKGMMDEYYIFNKVLNETELKELVQKCAPASTTTAHLPSTISSHSSSQMPTTATTTFTEAATQKLEQTTPTTKRYETTTPPTQKGISKADIEKAKKINNTSQAKEFLSELITAKIPKINNVSSNGSVDTIVDSEVMEITKALESIGVILARNTLKSNQSVEVKTADALLLMSIPTSGFVFSSQETILPYPADIVETGGKGNVFPRSEKTTLTFPDEIVETGGNGSRVVVCISYTKLHKVLAQNTTVSSSFVAPDVILQLNSKIIGAAVDPPLTKLPLKNPIEVTFTHAPVLQGKQICSFWDHTLGTNNETSGQWSTKGCELNVPKSSPTKTVCQCNHLTNFALLLQRDDVAYSAPPLSLKIITIVGSSLSILACVLCFIMFMTFKKKDTRHYLHINLSVAIAVSQVILVFGITATEHKELCKALAVGIHYFYLAAFLLMLSEGLHLAILIETAFTYGNVQLPAYLITSWGLPLVIVGITLGVRFDSYGGPDACFISAEKGTVFAFVGPFALILLINFVILIMVLRQVIKKTSLPISSKAASKQKIVKATIKSLVILFPVLGLSWIFGILFFGFRTLALEYLFGIFCSLQGFFIFLFQYVLNTENRSAFVRATQRWRSTTTSNFSRHSSADRSQKNGSDPSSHSCNHVHLDKAPAIEIPLKENCQLLVYRTVSGGPEWTDERTFSTFT